MDIMLPSAVLKANLTAEADAMALHQELEQGEATASVAATAEATCLLSVAASKAYLEKYNSADMEAAQVVAVA
eukprot:gene2431-8753_t